MNYLAAPDKYPCPLPLLLSRQRGDSRMLVAGGVMDQPLVWLACNMAANIDYKFEQWSKPEFTADRLSLADVELYNLYIDATMKRSVFNA